MSNQHKALNSGDFPQDFRGSPYENGKDYVLLIEKNYSLVDNGVVI